PLATGGESRAPRVRRRRTPARASPPSHGGDAVPWNAAREVGARAGLRVPPSPQLLRDGLAGRAALSRGVGAAAAHLVRSRNAGAAVQALPGSGDHSALDPRAPGADRERVEREGAMNP